MEKKILKNKLLHGTVVSNKMDKTIVVKITTKYPHPKYKKVVSKSKKFMVNSEEKIDVGTAVTITSHKPISKNKHWVLVK